MLKCNKPIVWANRGTTKRIKITSQIQRCIVARRGIGMKREVQGEMREGK